MMPAEHTAGGGDAAQPVTALRAENTGVHMKYQGVLFDFDYTLGDSTVPIVMGYQRSMEQMGWPAPTAEQVKPTIGFTLMDGYTMLTGDKDAQRRQEFYRRFQENVGEKALERGERAMVERTRLFPGTAELLTALREAGVHTGIVSTKLGSTIVQIFRFNGLEDALELVVGGGDVQRPKPDPQGLNGAMARLGLRPEEVLFCGDTTIDARTAQAAGTDFCAVLNGVTPAEDFAPLPHVHIAPDLRELRSWLGL